METLTKYFAQLGFEGQQLASVAGAFKLQTFRKNDLLVQEGKTSKYIGYVKSGMYQYYVIKDGEERTTYVNIANTWMASVMSFVSETPSLENIRALTDGSVYLISKTKLKQLVNEIPGFKDFYIVLLEQSN